jgi:NAD(P)-dependent dehydrogenase (short-subunit alcohol dehydrogenase family)
MISEGYVRAGAKVYISSRDAKSCEEACEQLNKMGPGTAAAIPADFYKEEDCKKLVEELGRRENSMYIMQDCRRIQTHTRTTPQAQDHTHD